MNLSVDELLFYTDEERARWERWFHENGDVLLGMRIIGDQETTVGRMLMHIFGPELRYVQRIKDEPLLEYRALPCSNVDEVFGFGLRTRAALRDFIAHLPPHQWRRVVQYELPGGPIRASIRKTVFHVLLHEIRHWAQVARLMRERGLTPPGRHDLLYSEAFE